MTDLSLIRTYQAPEILIEENNTLKSKNKILTYSLIGFVILGIYLIIKYSKNEDKIIMGQENP